MLAPKSIKYPSADPLLGLAHAREQRSLDGQWRLIVDPMGVGLPGGIFGGFPANRRSVTGMELIEYDFEASPTVNVPGDWNSQDEKLFFYQGRCWYYRTFDYEVAGTDRVHLYFGGANFNKQIFLNGEGIGEHQGGYVPFSFDVTDALLTGSNTLIVMVDNRLSAASVPMERTDWWPYGGLTRSVCLIETPSGYIRNAQLALTNLDSGKLEGHLCSVGVAAGSQAMMEIPELSLRITAPIDAQGLAHFDCHAALELWSPESPRLYSVNFSLGADSVSERIGFRTIATEGQRLLLNGKPLKLRGISSHEEPIGREGVACKAEDYERLLREASQLGCNFVRAAHYPYAAHMAQLADELGLLLWAEVPVYWAIDWDNAKTLAVARDQIERLVCRDWNRASVIIWSVANETPLSQPRMDFLQQLINDVRTLDANRLVSAALLGAGAKELAAIMGHLAARALAAGGLSATEQQAFEQVLEEAGPVSADAGYTVVIDDPLGELVDVVGYNQYFGWYYSVYFARRIGVGEHVIRPLMLAFMHAMRITAAVDKPILISEFGAGAKQGRRGGEALIFTEEYQAQVYQSQLAMLGASEQVQGISPWILKDFRAMLRTLAGTQDYYNRKGLMDENGNRKLAYDVLQRFYAGSWGNV